jgi:enamine deaminase RidA (YjgF/YER057c/UK114 family)
VIHSNTIYLAGVIPDDRSQPVGGQARQCLEKIDALLKTVGSDASNLLQVLIYVTDMNGYDEFNAVWKDFFKAQNMPARAMVGVKELGPGLLVELVATAALPEAPAD